MTTVSYPLSDTNFTSGQWREVFDGQHGIVGSSGTSDTSLDLTLSAVDNTATLKKGKIWYRGYVLEVTVDDAFTLAAAVGTSKLYSIGVMFDPANEATGPLSLYHDLKTNVAGDIPAGGSFLTVYEVTRQVSQILSLALKDDFRQFLGPNVWVPTGNLPGGAFLGTLVFDGLNHYLRVRNGSNSGGAWTNLTDPTWTNFTLASGVTAGSFGHTPSWRFRQGKIELRGIVQRTSGAFSGTGTNIATLPAATGGNPTRRPAASREFAARVNFQNANCTGSIDIGTDGILKALAPTTNVTHTWISLDGISFDPAGA